MQILKLTINCDRIGTRGIYRLAILEYEDICTTIYQKDAQENFYCVKWLKANILDSVVN